MIVIVNKCGDVYACTDLYERLRKCKDCYLNAIKTKPCYPKINYSYYYLEKAEEEENGNG